MSLDSTTLKWASAEARFCWENYERALHVETKGGLSASSLNFLLKEYRLNRSGIATLSSKDLEEVAKSFHAVFAAPVQSKWSELCESAHKELKKKFPNKLQNNYVSLYGKLLALYHPDCWPMYDRFARIGFTGVSNTAKSKLVGETYISEFLGYFASQEKEFANASAMAIDGPPVLRIADKYFWILGRNALKRQSFASKENDLKKRGLKSKAGIGTQ